MRNRFVKISLPSSLVVQVSICFILVSSIFVSTGRYRGHTKLSLRSDNYKDEEKNMQTGQSHNLKKVTESA